MPNRALQQKALKLKEQKATMMLGNHKRHKRNGSMISKFSPKNERAYMVREPKATVPSYDLAMVQVIPMKVSRSRKRK